MRSVLILPAAIAGILLSTPIFALPPLADNARIQSEFLAAAVGDQIRKNCPTISARMWRVVKKARELEGYAESLGHGDDDISALRKDPAAKAKLKSLRDAYLAENGVIKGNDDTYCRLGHQEIEKKTLTGWLLRAN